MNDINHNTEVTDAYRAQVAAEARADITRRYTNGEITINVARWQLGMR